MLKNGFTLAEGIRFLGKVDERSGQTYEKMLAQLQRGDQLFEVLHHHGFDRRACMQIYFAAQHGYLDETLQHAGGYLLKRAEDRRTLLKLCQYPVVLLFTVSFVMVLLNQLLFPRFEQMYQSISFQPHQHTQLLLHVMKNIPIYLICTMLLLLLVLMMSLFLLRRKTALQRAQWIGRIPYIGTYYQLYMSQFLAREWSFLLRKGFAVNEILSMMTLQNLRPLLEDTAEKLRELLKLGHSLSISLSHLQYLEKEFAVVVQHGEKSGLLAQELLFYSQYCLQRMEEKIKKLFFFMQPLMLVFIGLLVIAVYMSILLPMFQMLNRF